MRALGIMVVAACAQMVGCATVQPPNAPSISTKISPAVGQISTATVGTAVLDQGRFATLKYFALNEAFEVRDLLAKIAMPAGERLQEYFVDGVSSLCSDSNTYYDPIVGPYAKACLQDVNKDGAYEIVTYKPGAVWGATKLSSPVTVTQAETSVSAPDSYRYELIFQGSSSAGLRMFYREYINDLARPAFSQEAVYPVESLPMMVKFKKAEIEILEIKSSEIKYVVKASF